MMHILFEEENYSKDSLGKLGLQGFWRETGPATAKCNYVGFYKNCQTDVAVFTLPKIFLLNTKVFGKYDLEPFVYRPVKELLTPREYDTIRSLAERIYFCLRKYQHEEATSIIDRKIGFSIKSNVGLNKATSFEAMLALIAFNRNNPHLYVQERQISESKNPRSINWKKTFASTVPIEINVSIR